MIYLDYQATTPLAPEAFEAMVPWLRDHYANPHAAYPFARPAKAAVEAARADIARLLPPGGTLAFTGSATEALNWGIQGTRDRTPNGIVTLATEHAAVLDTVQAEALHGRSVTVLPVGPDGLVDLQAAAAAIRPGVGLVAAMLVNNEVGVIQPVGALADLAHRADALFLCDAVQGYGRVDLPVHADLIAIGGHKVHGPKGIGALWVRDGVELAPLLHGGGQEPLGRSGTLSPALCAGFGAAARLLAARGEADRAHVAQLFEIAQSRLGPDWILNGSPRQRYRGNLSIRRAGLDVARLMSELRDIAFSAGSACGSGSGRPSHVLRALGLDDKDARGTIRIGFGRYTTEEELVTALDRIDRAARAQRVAA